MITRAFISRDGTRIGCAVAGSGPPLVLVHGTAADYTRWRTVQPEFEGRFTVYAVDRRGRGQSGDATEYSIQREFEDIAAVVDGIGEPVNLVAHSFGALCSLEATPLTTGIRKLVLYEPPLRLGGQLYAPDVLARLQARLDAGDNEEVVTTFLREVARVPDGQLALMRSLPAWSGRVVAAHTIVRELQEHAEYLFRGGKFREVRLPVLLLLGGNSPELFAAAINAAHSALAGSSVTVLPGQSHVAMDTDPQLFVREVLEFLEG